MQLKNVWIFELFEFASKAIVCGTYRFAQSEDLGQNKVVAIAVIRSLLVSIDFGGKLLLAIFEITEEKKL